MDDDTPVSDVAFGISGLKLVDKGGVQVDGSPGATLAALREKVVLKL